MFSLIDKYKAIHLYEKRLSFPVVLFAKTKQESDIIQNYLTKDRIDTFNVIDFINWADTHNIDYQVIFPNYFTLLKKSIKNTMRLLCYICIKKRIKNSNHFVRLI